MSTVSVTPSKRKIIDLKDDTFKTLSIMAIQKGTNLKNYIEDILNGIAEDYEDAKLYAKLRKEMQISQQDEPSFYSKLNPSYRI